MVRAIIVRYHRLSSILIVDSHPSDQDGAQVVTGIYQPKAVAGTYRPVVSKADVEVRSAISRGCFPVFNIESWDR